LDGLPVEQWVRRIEIGPGPIPIKALLRQAGEAVFPLLFLRAKSKRGHDETRAFKKLGPVAWGLKAELERNIERPGDWVPELRQIWPDAAPRGRRKAP
jgi:hypothetical protein